MTKRVAYFDYIIKDGDDIVALTPNRAYKVYDEKDDTFVIKDDEGTPQFCLKGVKDCAHLNHKTTWILLDTEETSKKPKKWSKWIPHTTDEQPVADDVIVKVKWGRGCLDRGEAQAYWWQDKGITHYKLKLKDLEKSKPKKNTDWQDNVLGKRPVPKNTLVEVKLECGETFKGGAAFLNWGDTPMEGRNIIKWRFAK